MARLQQLVVEYLNSGLFDVGDVAKIIDRYVAEAATMRAHHLAKQLHEHVVWHHKLTDVQLVEEAQQFADKAHLLDVYNITSLHELIAGLANGGPVADSMIDNWIQAFQAKATEGFNYDNFWARPIHPRIKEAIDNAKSLAEAKTTVFDACVHIVKQSGWGYQQETIMRSASVKDFDATIRSLEPDDLRLFMCRFLEMCVQPGNYEKHFGSAMENFVQACREICADPAGGRLATLIQLLFKDAKLELVSDAMTEQV